MPQDPNKGSHRNGGRAQVLPTSDRVEDLSKPHNARSSIASTPDPVLYGVAFLLIIFGITFLILGSVYAVHCPIMPMVPLWLLIMGVILLAIGIWHGVLFRRIKRKPFMTIGPVEKTISGIIFVFYIVWFLAGNAWVYMAWGENPDFAHEWFTNYCNKSIFILSLCTIIAMDCLVGLFLILFCFWGLSHIIVRE